MSNAGIQEMYRFKIYKTVQPTPIPKNTSKGFEAMYSDGL
jgi:hypothetical protein